MSDLTEVIRCGHCGNKAPMRNVAEYSAIQSVEVPGLYSPHTYDMGEVYELLLCLSCKGVVLRGYFYHEEFLGEGWDYKYLHPSPRAPLAGVPENIQKAYEAAHKVEQIDLNAYGVLLGRVIELVCDDRKAKGKMLGERIASLCESGDIPKNLEGVAIGLKDFRNIGAHATLGEISVQDASILDDLCRAILIYVYSAPFLADQVREQLAKRKPK